VVAAVGAEEQVSAPAAAGVGWAAAVAGLPRRDLRGEQVGHERRQVGQRRSLKWK
jgi:hypothetical protein